jgi:uncharacterized protein (TIGR02646 family)
MRPIDKSLFISNQVSYIPYGEAKPDLIAAIGKYCSYCEREGFSSALDVEHIEDKDTHPALTYLWSNFLLSCKNCNSIKNAKEIDFGNILLPYLDNTYSPFEYLESGFIKIKNDLGDSLMNKASELIQLIGLDRYPNHPKYSRKDNRWEERKQAWEISKKYKNKYKCGSCDIETIVDLSLNIGFWSIWMNAFTEFPEVQKELILRFSGTNQTYFYEILNGT